MKTIQLTQSQHRGLCEGIDLSGIAKRGLVPLAAAIAKRVPLTELEDPHLLEGLYSSRTSIAQVHGDAFGIEKEMKETLAEELALVNKKISRLEIAGELDLPILDPSFLSWKTRAGYPGFSIYTLEDPVSQIWYSRSNLGIVRDRSTKVIMNDNGKRALSMAPHLPGIMAEYYLDKTLKTNLELKLQNEGLSKVELTAKYVGAMPSDVRDKVHFYTKGRPDGQMYFEEIFIIAEAPKWSERCEPIAIGDPLVVGVKEGYLWLIADYDLTPSERLAKDLCAAARHGSDRKVLN